MPMNRLRPARRVLDAATLLFLVSLGALGLAATAAADEGPLGVPFETPPAELLAAADGVEAPAGTSLVVISRRRTLSFDEAGRLTFRIHTLYQPRDQQGVETSGWSTVGQEWAPWHQERPRIRARVIALGGTVRELDPSTLVESPTAEISPDIFDDRLAVEAPLPGLRPGVVVETEIELRDREPYFAAGTSGSHYLVSAAFIARDVVELEAPEDLPLRHRLLGVEEGSASVEESVEDGRRRVVVTRLDVERFEVPEPSLPYDVPRFPALAYATGESWGAVAESYARVVERQLEGAELSALLAELPEGLEGRAKVDAVLAAVQERVRYTGLELGAASLVPRPPAQTLEREFGDCKDKSTLVVAALRAAGIDAHVALLRAGFDGDVAPELPGIGLFNHAIVRVPEPAPGEAPLWIDPTDPYARAGQLPLADQGRLALVAGDDAQGLVTVPASESDENRLVKTREIILADHGPGRVTETNEYFGAFELEHRSLESLNAEDRREGYQQYVRRAYSADSLASFEETPARDLEAPYRLRLEAADAGIAVTELDEAWASFPLSGLLSELSSSLLDFRDDVEERRHPFHQVMPQVVEYRGRIVPPPGFVLRELPEGGVETYGAARFEKHFEQDGEAVTVRVVFDSGPRRLDAETFEATRQGLEELSQGGSPLLVFDHRATLDVEAGRSRRAILELRETIAAGRGGALDHVRLARALLSVGLGAEARAEARRAVELAPELAMAHWGLGFVLSHDEIGRLRAPGFDAAGARAALERGVELDPESRLILSELAILLDFDSEGRRYGEGADLDAAIERYRAWREEFGNGLDANLMATLAKAGRWEELEELTGEMAADGGSRDLWRLAALAVNDGSERALAEVRRLGAGRDVQLELLSNVGQQLLLARHYATAADLLRRVAAISPNPAGGQFFADLIAKVRRLEELELPEDDPASVLKRFTVFSMTAEESDVEGLLELIHPDTRRALELGDEDLEELFEELTVGREQGSEGMPLQVLAELAVAVSEVHREGDDELGYRLELRSQLEVDAESELAYVERHGGGYRITAFEDSWGALAYEVLRRVEAGDLAGARQWLDWARRSLPALDAEDPLVMVPFTGVWSAGSETDEASKLRLAAHVLLAFDPGYAEQAEEPLTEALAELRPDAPERRAIELALADALGGGEKWAQLEDLLRRLVEEEPGSSAAFRSLAGVLHLRDQLDALIELAEARLESEDEDLREAALLALGSVAVERLDRGEVERLVGELEKLGPDAADPLWNQLAWLMLYEDPVPESALSTAQRAAQKAGYTGYASLHTLATAYALEDRPAEAYRAMSQALGLKPSHEVEEDDWLVFGLIAESCGLPEAARAYYAKLERPEEGVELSSWQLARQRLEKMSRAEAEEPAS